MGPSSALVCLRPSKRSKARLITSATPLHLLQGKIVYYHFCTFSIIKQYPPLFSIPFLTISPSFYLGFASRDHVANIYHITKIGYSYPR